MTLAVVRNVGAPRGLRSEQDVDDFEQEIVDQYALAMAAAGSAMATSPRRGRWLSSSRALCPAGCGLRRSMTPIAS